MFESKIRIHRYIRAASSNKLSLCRGARLGIHCCTQRHFMRDLDTNERARVSYRKNRICLDMSE